MDTQLHCVSTPQRFDCTCPVREMLYQIRKTRATESAGSGQTFHLLAEAFKIGADG